ncbi:hypothetical protein E8E13_001124 [Curvularia kusanoi]|uniref:ABC transporter n=1 Tax=Curvularia kusanoi TaxID=90978 RepID=A0A9P4T5P0_CURKU|nr:hypothetical protein E8E13_001124 [Curvularia kusanoi]
MAGITAITAASISVVATALFSSFTLLDRKKKDARQAKYVALAGDEGDDIQAQSGESVDEEGDNDEEAVVKKGSAFTYMAAMGAAIGLLTSAMVVKLSYSIGAVLLVTGWGLVAVQALTLLYERSGYRRFRIGYRLAASCGALWLASIVLALRDEMPAIPLLILTGAAAVGAALAAVSALSLPRATVDSARVDAQHAVSALSKHSFAWARPLLDRVRKNQLQLIQVHDLPSLTHQYLTRHLRHRFPPSFQPSTRPLWRNLITDHRRAIAIQWGLTVIESVLLVGPQAALFKLLTLLEHKATDEADLRQLWLWASGLAVLKIAHLFIESWIEWVNFALLATPIRSQLSALIYDKCMRLKDVKTATSSPNQSAFKERSRISNDNLGIREDDDSETETLITEDERANANADGGDDNSSKEASNENVQGAINLLGVDVQRVSDFAGYNVLIPGSFFKIIIASAFLVNLIGWASTIVGLAVPIVFQPLNQVATRGYSNAAEAVMMTRDEKAHVVAEALHGIRQIKLSAIEPQWQDIIMATRDKELSALWRLFKWAAFMTFAWLSMPILLGATALGSYAWINGSITPAIAFTALSVFSSLEWTLSVVPTTITELLDAKVSIARIEQHLKQPNERKSLKSGDCVAFDHATVSWPSQNEGEGSFLLRDINLRFPNNEFSVVYGKTGSGKSLLLAAILGEADIISGSITAPRVPSSEQRMSGAIPQHDWIVPSLMAFVAQIPWIENASVKDNVLFGLPYEQSRYRKVLDACALTKDLRMLPDGEETEIGASGINLSGGQRWRVTLARALYSRAGILVLDDIFSAVDAHVGQHILGNALHGDLIQGRTRILVTHHVGLVSSLANYIVELGEGGVRNVTRHTPTPKSLERLLSQTAASDNERAAQNEVDLDVPENPDAPMKFVEDEFREKGRVKLNVYKAYMSSSGGTKYWSLVIGLYALSALSMLGRSYWVKHWTQMDLAKAHASSGADDHGIIYYLAIYITISALATSLIAIKSLTVLRASIRASHKLFEIITHTVLRAPLRWLDTVPTGRIMNRFVSDFALVDSRLAGDFNWSFHGFLIIITIICSALFVSLLMIAPIAIFAVVSLYYTNIYLEGVRDIKRLESNAKSPIFELLGSSLAGLATVRSFGKVEEYMDRMFDRIDDYGRATWHLLLASRWMSFRQGLFGSMFTFVVAAAVISIDGISASLAGFTLSFALDYSNIAIQTITRYTGFELDMNSAERVVEYTKMKTEDPSGAQVHPEWPREGRLEVHNLNVRYAPELPLVLKGLSFSIPARQRVGVVGRTGSGKSSLSLALFRVLEAEKGSIVVDGVDISKIRLSDLRSRLAIIPQDPVLFSGTLRSNLDPSGRHSDSELNDALRRVHLLESDDVGDVPGSNVNIFRNLRSQIARGGLNLSQGQRQLLCLARAMVSRPRIMVLDEATSAVDMATDQKIQRSIRGEFTHSTLIVIAHRLSTIADFDQVLVMDNGCGECDTPARLMKSNAVFGDLLAKSGEREAIEKIILGGGEGGR